VSGMNWKWSDLDSANVKAEAPGSSAKTPGEQCVNEGKRCEVCNATLSAYNPYRVPVCQPCARKPEVRVRYSLHKDP
jgi:hypothetical protein